MRFIYLLLFISPLPFASARPVWQYFWVVFIGFSGLIYALRWKSLNDTKLPKVFYFPVGATLFLIFWGTLQVAMSWTVTSEHTIMVTLYFFSHLVWFFLVFKSFKRQADIPKFILMIGLVVTAYCIYGLTVYFSGNEMILWYKKWASQESLTSTFVNRNSFAAYVGIGFQCMLAYALYIYSQAANVSVTFKESLLQLSNKNTTQTIGVMLSLVLLLTSLLLTASRAGIMTSLIGALALFLCFILQQPSTDMAGLYFKKRLVLFSSYTLLAVMAFNLSGELFSSRMEGLSENDMRFVAYPLMINTIQENPIKGTGIGTFVEHFAQYRPANMPQTFNKGHSDILEILITAGLLAGGMFLVSLLFIARGIFMKSFKSHNNKLILLAGGSILLQITLHSVVDFSLQMPSTAYTFTALLATCSFALSRER